MESGVSETISNLTSDTRDKLGTNGRNTRDKKTSLEFQHFVFQRVLLVFFLLVCKILSPVCPSMIWRHKIKYWYSIIYNRTTLFVWKLLPDFLQHIETVQIYIMHGHDLSLPWKYPATFPKAKRNGIAPSYEFSYSSFRRKFGLRSRISLSGLRCRTSSGNRGRMDKRPSYERLNTIRSYHRKSRQSNDCRDRTIGNRRNGFRHTDARRCGPPASPD